MTELMQLCTLDLQQICCTVASEKQNKKPNTADLQNLLDNAKKKKKVILLSTTKKFEEGHNVFTISLIVLMAV